MQRKRIIQRKHVSTKSLSGPNKKTVVRLLSMQNIATFRSQIETEYRQSNLSRGVLSQLFSQINASGIRLAKKRKMLEIVTDYNSKV